MTFYFESNKTRDRSTVWKGMRVGEGPVRDDNQHKHKNDLKNILKISKY